MILLLKMKDGISMKMTMNNKNATYVTINLGEAITFEEIRNQSICINKDIGEVLNQLE